jgi:hypothetical protein
VKTQQQVFAGILFLTVNQYALFSIILLNLLGALLVMLEAIPGTYFQVVNKGAGKIEFVYRRSWEQDRPPAQIFTLNVYVRP